jgi:hypothetical protein
MTLIPIRWNWDIGPDEPVFDGFWDGSSRWNGFACIWVTEATHAAVVAEMMKQKEPNEFDNDTLGDFLSMRPEENGLISYGGGFTPKIIRMGPAELDE